MQPRTRSTKFVRSFVQAATVGPMMSALLEMKRARVHGSMVSAPVALLELEVVAQRQAA